ncbi:MAG: hypothetical protein PHR77_15040 [Kiritimatiellae bacterium]|nr:hypothetical protein [Kiritimatiellia bacterium]MDD5521437.1 hypothetical protein [Kiritimatiellia bacterium]
MAKLIFRALLVAGLSSYSWYFLTATMLELGDKPGFIHLIHTVFHEAGHVLLAWTPEMIHYLGGTIGQLAVPMALSIAFLVKNRDRFSAAICLWWFGQSLVDVAPYINDARASRLILLGGATGTDIEGHDWMYILDQLHILSMDVKIARVILASGRVVMVVALVTAVLFIVWDFMSERRLQASKKS